MERSRRQNPTVELEEKDAKLEGDRPFETEEKGKEMESEPKSKRGGRGKWNPARSLRFKNNKQLWIWLLVAIALGVGGSFGWQWWSGRQSGGANSAQSAPGGGQPSGVPVRVSPVEMTLLRETSDFVGNLEARQSVGIQSEISGRVSEIYIRDGDRVGQGDPLVKIDARDAEVQLQQARAAQASAEARLEELRAGPRREAIASARARLQQAEAQLAELRAGNRPQEIAQARARLERARSKLDALRGGSRTDEIAQAEAALEEAKARVELSAKRVERNRELLAEGAIARDTFDAVQTENEQARASVERARQRIEELERARQEDIEQAEAEEREAREAFDLQRAGARPEEIAQAEAIVAEREQALRELENGTRPEAIAAAEAQLSEAIARVRAAQVQLEDTVIFAPFSGTVGDVTVKLGDYVDSGDRLTTLTQNQALELEMPIPVERLAELRTGLPVEITDSAGNSLAEGRISFVSPTIDRDSQTVLAKASFDNAKGQLIDGQFVRAKVIWEQRPNSVVVPSNAIIFQGQDRFVFVARGNDPQVAERRAVKLGTVQGDRSEILEGLRPGDQLIVSGLQQLADGAPIMPLGDPQADASPATEAQP
jgi:RND family efflux transporter MFP subunit